MTDSFKFAMMDKSSGDMVAFSQYSRGCHMACPYLVIKKSVRGSHLGNFCTHLGVKFARNIGFMGMYTDIFSDNLAQSK